MFHTEHQTEPTSSRDKTWIQSIYDCRFVYGEFGEL